MNPEAKQGFYFQCEDFVKKGVKAFWKHLRGLQVSRICTVSCICPGSSYIPLVFDYLQVSLLPVCTEACFKQQDISVSGTPEPSTIMERMQDEKVNLTFVFQFLIFPLQFSVCIRERPPHCVLLKRVS